jgi:polysaccharide export outer membrane protein
LLLLLTTGCQIFAAPPLFTPPTAPSRSGNSSPESASATTDSASLYTQIDDNYTLRPGDQISFAVEQDRKPSIELTVMASGEIEIPQIGRFQVAGKTCKAVAAQLKADLEKQYYKKATVSVSLNRAASVSLQGTGNIRVYFTGAVMNGAKEFPPDGKTTVSKAILISGGFRDYANKNKVQLIRKDASGKSSITIVNVEDILRGKQKSDPVLQAEDMIYVPEKLINF